MPSASNSPDASTSEPTQSAVRKGFWSRTEALLVALALEGDVVTLGAAFVACEAGRQWLVALELLCRARARHMEPSGALPGLMGCLKAVGRWQEALQSDRRFEGGRRSICLARTQLELEAWDSVSFGCARTPPML